MHAGIYKIEDQQGKIYIGSAVSLKGRWTTHKWRLNNNKHPNLKLQRAWNKYGAEYFTFSVVELIEDKSRLLHYEQIWLDILFSSLDREDIYNILTIAGNHLGSKRTDEAKTRMSLAQKNVKSRVGRRHTLEHKIKIGLAGKGNAYNAKTYVLLSPDGTSVEITNMRKFCRELSLGYSHMCEVANGKRKSAHGWRLL